MSWKDCGFHLGTSVSDFKMSSGQIFKTSDAALLAAAISYSRVSALTQANLLYSTRCSRSKAHLQLKPVTHSTHRLQQTKVLQFAWASKHNANMIIPVVTWLISNIVWFNLLPRSHPSFPLQWHIFEERYPPPTPVMLISCFPLQGSLRCSYFGRCDLNLITQQKG